MALHMSTVLSKSSSEILSHLSRIRSSFSSQITLFALSVSSSHDASEVSSLVSHLMSLTEQSVGCLSSRIDNGMLSGEDAFSCSVAVFDKSSATPFRSTIPGRQAAQVGRWHSNRRRKEDNGCADAPSHKNGLDWDDVWAKNSREHALPPEIQSLQHDNLDTVIYLSDGSPEGLTSALHTLPVATSIGMIGASTPFITGRPYTLFRGKSIYSSGAVGLCLSCPSPPHSHLAFPGMQALTPPMLVTESEGNLIHSLDNTNPTRLLLAAIERAQDGPVQQAGGKAEWISKEDQFYVATLSALSNEPQQIYRITSGDPSRGTLALEGDFAPSKGAPVRVYQQPADTQSSFLSQDASIQVESAISRTRITLSLAVSPPEAANMSPPVTSDDTTIVLEDTFLAATENGLLIDRYKWQLGAFRERPWLCKVPGAVMNMCWG